MSEPDKFEDDLLYAMTRTGEGFHAGQGDLVAGGYQRGRRRWRRRSAAAVVSGAAALALVGTGAVYLSGSGASPDRVSAAAAPAAGAASGPATGTASAPTPASGSAAATPATPTAKASTAAPVITGDEMLTAFKALLPKGEITQAKGRGTDDSQAGGSFVGADLVFDDGQGKSLIQLGIQKNHKGQNQEPSCPSDFTSTRTDSCSVTTLPDGSKLWLNQGHEYSDQRADTKEWSAGLTGPDGRYISVSEWNSPQEKGAPDSRPNPPLTLEQLKAIVTDKSWDRVVASVKYSGVDYEAIDPGLSAEDRQAVVAKLLPAGITVTGHDAGSPTALTLQLAQGQSAGSLVLRVENWAKSPDGGIETAYKDATVLPDGSRILTRGGGAEGPSSQLAVNVLRPDGMQVMLVQGAKGKALLTPDQLKAIATSPEWKAKK
ncbi:hypothetical protein [Kitasatospora sp. NPDC097643]|uniref:hypothetical protein n=1 Tax=Kitasatospora sp. NPDC097643 TaxID=3157230 RepID=UPI00331AC9C3